MLLNDIQLEQLQLRRECEVVEAARIRLLPLESPSIRRAIGRSIMSIGAWLAAEPHAALARSR
jgi:hypothetical protein